MSKQTPPPAALKDSPRVQELISASFAAVRRGATAEAASLLSLAIDKHLETKEALPRSAYYDLGVLLYKLERFDEAEERIHQGLKRRPKDFALNNLLGVVLKNAERHAEALKYFEVARQVEPNNTSPLFNMGNTYLLVDEGAKAADIFSRLIRLEPRSSEHHRLLGAAYRRMGKSEQALRQYENARRIDPRNQRAWVDAASQLEEIGRPDDGLELLKTAFSVIGADRLLIEGRLSLLRRAGRMDEAIAFAHSVAESHPGQAWVQHQIARCFSKSDRAKASEYLSRAIELEPSNPRYLVEQCENFDRIRGDEEAGNIEKAYRLAKQRLPLGGDLLRDSHVVRNVLQRACDFEAAESLGGFEALGAYWVRMRDIAALHYHMAQVKTPEQRRALLAYHRHWGRTVDAVAKQAPIARPPAVIGRAKIRIGLMSSDLRHHPVSYFALPLIEHYDRDRFEVYCYSWFPREADHVQTRIAGRVDAFRLAPNISDRDAAQLIANDNLDFLFELGGTTEFNKLPVMSWRPARIQGSWLGYPHSSGLETVDYIVVDPFIRPAKADLLIEKPLELEHSWVVLGSLGFNDLVPIEPGTPEERRGHLTFGTMNNPYKYTPEMLSTWAQITAAVDGAHFLFVRPEGATVPFQNNVREIFEANGVGAHRVDFVGVRATHLPHYNKIDVALDTFPQTGGTTTCEALWMGVPTVSLVGEAFFERLSYSNLSNAGLGDLCVFDHSSYVAKALALAADRERRSELRRTLRSRIRDLPLGRQDLFAADFQAAVMRAVEALGS